MYMYIVKTCAISKSHLNCDVAIAYICEFHAQIFAPCSSILFFSATNDPRSKFGGYSVGFAMLLTECHRHSIFVWE